MLETTFRSIIQFRRHVGSIRAQTHSCGHLHTHTHTRRFSCHGVRTLFACSCHTDDVCVMCWRARWPKQPAAFPQGWHFHYTLTTWTASIQTHRSLRQTLTTPLPLICIPPLLLHHRQSFLKRLWHTFVCIQHIFSRCHRWEAHKTCREVPHIFNLLAFALCRLLPSIAAGK